MQTLMAANAPGANRLAIAGEADVKMPETGKSGHLIVFDPRSAGRHSDNA